MKEKLRVIINTVLENRGRNQIETIDEDINLRDSLGMDSLDLAELTVRIEAEFGVDVFKDGIINTVAEIMQKISK